MTNPSHAYRIAPIDGLRGFAALGVVWVHAWNFSGNPALSVGKIEGFQLDLHRALAIWGQGLDMFFVISGFCMYLMYARKQTQFSWGAYWEFLKNRWVRIAPAFYTSMLVCALGITYAKHWFPWPDVLAHLTFLHIIIPQTNGLASPFWSLATEWHFYLLLPLILWAGLRYGFWRTAFAFMTASLLYRLWFFGAWPNADLALRGQIPVRLIEFYWGLCVARFYTEKRAPPRWLAGAGGVLLSFGIAYVGRVLMLTEAMRGVGRLGFVMRAFSEPVLSFGFALLLWSVMTTPSIFQNILSHWTLQTLGRWSYSFYLWHWWPCMWLAFYFKGRWGAGLAAQYAAYLLCVAFLLPVAWLSYKLLEEPYFRWRTKRQPIIP